MNSAEVQPPGGDRPFITHRVERSEDCTSLTLFDDVPLDLVYSPVVESSVSKLYGCASPVQLTPQIS